MQHLIKHRFDLGLLAIRLMAGTVFVFHGAQKLFGVFGGPGIDGFAAFNESLGIPLPYLGAWAAALAEFAGGLALLAGVGVSVAAVPLTATMLVAAFVAHSGFSAQTGGMEYPLTLAVIATALGLMGAGRYNAIETVRSVRPASTPSSVSTTNA